MIYFISSALGGAICSYFSYRQGYRHGWRGCRRWAIGKLSADALIALGKAKLPNTDGGK